MLLFFRDSSSLNRSPFAHHQINCWYWRLTFPSSLSVVWKVGRERARLEQPASIFHVLTKYKVIGKGFQRLAWLTIHEERKRRRRSRHNLYLCFLHKKEASTLSHNEEIWKLLSGKICNLPALIITPMVVPGEVPLTVHSCTFFRTTPHTHIVIYFLEAWLQEEIFASLSPYW